MADPRRTGPERAPLTASPNRQDWSHFDPVAYLDEYYADVGSENLALLRFMVDAYRCIPKGGILLDFGGGPTLYPLISAVHHFDEIHFAEFLESNLDEVRRWLADDPTAFDWDPFIRQAIELETLRACSDDEVDRRAREIRGRVTRLLHCDASRTPPIDGLERPYDVVLSNFCAESATAARAQWRSYMANIASLVRPGGWLVISALEGATRYAVGPHSFPAVDVSQRELRDLLHDLGFQPGETSVCSVPADRPSRDYKGLMFALAQKHPTTPEAGQR